jgi:hypothetical protein
MVARRAAIDDRDIRAKSITVSDAVEGGPLEPDEEEGRRGVVVASQPRRECVACRGPGASEYEDIVRGRRPAAAG